MAQVVYRGNLSAKVFPFVSEYFGRTIIVPQQDQNYSRQLASAEDLDKDRGIPQVYYCHNVMPTSDGFESVGYATNLSDTKSGFTELQFLIDINDVQAQFSNTATGRNYVLLPGATSWLETTNLGIGTKSTITTATISGQTYIYFNGYGCYYYDVATNTLINVVLTGLDTTKILGITNSVGYMIAWTAMAVAWSSTVPKVIPSDPFDFVPSLVTGAGGGNIEAAKGAITYCLPHYLGFIIYTVNNAVAALYSNNAKYPFNFREIIAAGGLLDQSLITLNGPKGAHIAFTNAGLQIINVNGSDAVYPELTDFLAGRYFEDFDDNAKVFTSTVLTSPMKKLVSIISSRYLVLSYGITTPTHAVVFDLVQKRYGKLKVSHVDCFDYEPVATSSAETARQSIGFLQANGTILTVDLSYGSSNTNGTMLIGKFQYVRSRLITMESIDLENIRVGNTFNISLGTAIHGKTVNYTTPYLSFTDGTSRRYSSNVTGINHSYLMQGAFYMTSFVLTFKIHGRR